MLVIGFFMFTSVVYAAGKWGDEQTVPINNISFTPSKKVSIYWDVDQNNDTYALGSKHTKGNRVFATTSATNQIYYNEKEDYVNKSGSEAITATNMPSAGQSSFGEDWHTL